MQDLAQNKEKFCASQQARIGDLMRFVKEQRARRKQVCRFHGCWASSCEITNGSNWLHLKDGARCKRFLSSSFASQTGVSVVLTSSTGTNTTYKVCIFQLLTQHHTSGGSSCGAKYESISVFFCGIPYRCFCSAPQLTCIAAIQQALPISGGNSALCSVRCVLS